MLADESFGTTGQGYTLTRVHQENALRIRISIRRDFYLHQSSAVAEVLTPALTWTRIAEHPPSQWHSSTPHRAGTPAPLTRIAEQLLERALAILRP
jgi:hypothetical protein